MKVVLIQPPVEDFYHTELRLQPLGLAFLKAAVRRHLPQVKVVILDYHQGYRRRSIPLPAGLRYLRRYYPVADKSPFATFYHFYHFGAEYDVIAEEVAAQNPDLVGISSPFSAYYREVLHTAEAIRKRSSVPIVAGGAHATAAPESLLENKAIDWVIAGGGERPLVELLQAMAGEGTISDVPGLIYRHQGKVLGKAREENYPMGEIGVPDFSDWSPGRYVHDRSPLATLMTSRGCPQQCSFCSVHLVFGTRSERRAVESVYREIENRYREGYRAFDFEEDHFAGDPAFVADLCRRIQKGFAGKAIRLLAMNGISHWYLEKELLALMKAAGFTSLNLSLVSVDRETCHQLHRPHRPELFQKCVELAHSMGFQITVYQILGLPGESLEAMTDTLAFLARLPVLIGPSPFYPVPGAPLLAGRESFSGEDLVRCRLTAFSMETPDCSRDQLYTLLVVSRILNFLKGLPLKEGEEEEDLLSRIKKQTMLSHREKVGVEILMRLFQENTLYAFTGSGYHRLEAFDAVLFRRVWEKMEFLQNQQGQKFLIREP